MSKILKIYFLGSGPIAVPVLRCLAAAADIEIAGVATQPDQPAGRRRELRPTPLAEAAEELGMTALRIPDVNAPEFIATLRQAAVDMVLVVSFGQLLKSELLELPPCGCINVHASILPRYRGASPIVQAILNQDPVAGVAFMRMERGLDTGPVYRVLERPMDGTECADTLEIELGELAGRYAAEIMHDIAGGVLQAVPQDDSAATKCGKICRADGRIDWRKSAADISAMVRAYSPWPGAWSDCRSEKGESAVTICRIAAADGVSGVAPGEIQAGSKKKLIVGCGDGAVEVLELQPAGGKRMTGAAFLNGLRGGEAVFTLP